MVQLKKRSCLVSPRQPALVSPRQPSSASMIFRLRWDGYLYIGHERVRFSQRAHVGHVMYHSASRHEHTS